MLDPKKDNKILEVACGNGVFTRKLAKKGCKVVGIDISTEAITRAKMITGNSCELVIGNAEYLPFQSNVFDKVISLCSLEHFKNDEKALSEIYRVLKSGGIIVLTVDSFTYELNEEILYKHKKEYAVVNYYSVGKLKEKLEKFGFKIISYKYFVNSPFSVFFLKFGIQNRFGYIYKAIFPVAYVLSTISDIFLGKRDKGIFLAVKAIKAI